MSRFSGLKKSTGLRCCSSNVALMFPYSVRVVRHQMGRDGCRAFRRNLVPLLSACR